EWGNRLRTHPQVTATEEFLLGYALWKTPGGSDVLVCVLGCELSEHPLGPLAELEPGHRSRLTEFGSVVVAGADQRRLGDCQDGQVVAINSQRVRIVGFTDRLSGLTAPYVVCSLATARLLLDYTPDVTTYILVACRHPGPTPALIEELQRQYPKV